MATMTIHLWVQFTSKSTCTNSVREMIETLTTKIDCIISELVKTNQFDILGTSK